MVRCALVRWLVLLGPCVAMVARAQVVGDPACRVVPMVTVSGAVTYRLPFGFVRAGSDSVWTRSGPWRRGVDYLFDPLHGDVRVLHPVVPGETLWVAACRLLSPPPLEFSLLRYRPAPAATSPGGVGGTDSLRSEAPRVGTGLRADRAGGGHGELVEEELTPEPLERV